MLIAYRVSSMMFSARRPRRPFRSLCLSLTSPSSARVSVPPPPTTRAARSPSRGFSPIASPIVSRGTPRCRFEPPGDAACRPSSWSRAVYPPRHPPRHPPRAPSSVWDTRAAREAPGEIFGDPRDARVCIEPRTRRSRSTTRGDGPSAGRARGRCARGRCAGCAPEARRRGLLLALVHGAHEPAESSLVAHGFPTERQILAEESRALALGVQADVSHGGTRHTNPRLRVPRIVRLHRVDGPRARDHH